MNFETKGKYFEAINMYRHSFTIRQTAAAAYNIGRLLAIMGTSRDNEGPLLWFEEALRLDTRHLPSLLEAGIHTHFLGDDSRALGHYLRILEVDGHHLEALYNIGVSYQYLGEVEVGLVWL